MTISRPCRVGVLYIQRQYPVLRAKELRGATRRPPRRFTRYASLTAGAGAWRRRCAKSGTSRGRERGGGGEGYEH